MPLLDRLVSGFTALLRKDGDERDLDEELRAFLDADVDERMRSGMSREDAVRAARAHIGSLEAVKDHTRDAGWESRLESVWRDVRYAVRGLRRSPGFAAVAVRKDSFNKITARLMQLFFWYGFALMIQ